MYKIKINNMLVSDMLLVSDIMVFFKKYPKSLNDSKNKIREIIIPMIPNLPEEFIENPEYGDKWRMVCEEFTIGFKKLAKETGVPSYTSMKIEAKGGRNSHYDANLLFYNEDNLVGTRKMEFKNGGKKISNQPQFLSLSLKSLPFSETYASFYYWGYIDKYMAIDDGITEPKPSFSEYEKLVSKDKSNHPFFVQLKERENVCKKEKASIVNRSIKEYLEKEGPNIDIKTLSEKIYSTQIEKNYFLWDNYKLHYDKLLDSEMTNLSYDSIKNGNKIILRKDKTIYGVLLRWKNHKGILFPAWQISMKRE